MSYVINGKFFKGEIPEQKLGNTAVWKQSDHARQRKDHQRELVQPFDSKGRPNLAFIEAWPEESKQYGFLPSDEKLKGG